MSDRDERDLLEAAAAERGQSLAEMSESTKVIDSSMLQQAYAAQQNNHEPCLILLTGPHVGRMYKLDQDAVTLGRSPKVEIELNDAGASRKHASILRRGDAVFIEDLQSANGTYVNGRRITADCQLQQGDKITIGTSTALKFTYQDELDENFQRQMFDAALKDALTGAYNKKFLLTYLESELARALRKGRHLSLLMFDIDHFKPINDTYGHLTGDRILAGLGEAVAELVGGEHKFVRYGGEEFAVVCRDTPLQACAKLGNQIRKRVEALDFDHEGQPIPVTISVGVTEVPAVAARTPDELIEAADQALYAAKDAGRNRVMIKGS